MYKKYVVRLSDEERGVCQEVVKKLKGSSQKARRARILLKADADGPGWPDTKIAEAQRDYQSNVAQYQAAVNQKKAEADLAYDLQKYNDIYDAVAGAESRMRLTEPGTENAVLGNAV